MPVLGRVWPKTRDKEVTPAVQKELSHWPERKPKSILDSKSRHQSSKCPIVNIFNYERYRNLTCDKSGISWYIFILHWTSDILFPNLRGTVSLKIAKNLFQWLNRINMAYPWPLATCDEELLTKSPFTSVADNFPMFPQKTSSVICSCKKFPDITVADSRNWHTTVLPITLNCSWRLLPAIDKMESLFLLSAFQLLATSCSMRPIERNKPHILA